MQISWIYISYGSFSFVDTNSIFREDYFYKLPFSDNGSPKYGID